VCARTFNDTTNGRKTLRIQKGIALGAGIDKELRRARVGTRRGKHDRTPRIGHLDGIVGQRGAPPLGLHVGIAMNAKLHHKAGQYSKKATLVPKTNVGQFLYKKKACAQQA
jgi:hypothetical protein